MAVEDVKIPKRMFNLDPRDKGKTTQKDSAEYWDEQAKAARAKREYLEETKMSQHITQPESPPEPPFKIEGKVNLGTFDFQEEKRRADETAERTRKDALDKISQAEKDRDEARKSLNDANLSHMQSQLGAKIEDLQRAIVQNDRGNIIEQLAGIEKLAGILGYQKPIAGPTDSALTIELKRLEWQMKKEERDFQRQMKADERLWQIELKKLDQQARESEGRLQAEKDKYSLLASTPERIGNVFAQAIMDRANDDTTVTQKNGVKQFHIEAGEGEFGEIPCPKCKTPIGIAPTLREAECINCHTKIAILRKPTPPLDEETVPDEKEYA